MNDPDLIILIDLGDELPVTSEELKLVEALMPELLMDMLRLLPDQDA